MTPEPREELMEAQCPRSVRLWLFPLLQSNFADKQTLVLIPKREWILRLAAGQNGDEKRDKAGQAQRQMNSLSTLLQSASSASNPRRLHACLNEPHTSPSTVLISAKDFAPVTCTRRRRRTYLSPSRGPHIIHSAYDGLSRAFKIIL